MRIHNIEVFCPQNMRTTLQRAYIITSELDDAIVLFHAEGLIASLVNRILEREREERERERQRERMRK